MKLTVHKTVYWKEGSRECSGKVRLIMGNHVVVETDLGKQIVQKGNLYFRKQA